LGNKTKVGEGGREGNKRAKRVKRTLGRRIRQVGVFKKLERRKKLEDGVG
jgi:hypothetical protein